MQSPRTAPRSTAAAIAGVWRINDDGLVAEIVGPRQALEPLARSPAPQWVRAL